MKGMVKIFLIIEIIFLSIGAIPNSNKNEFNLLEEKIKKVNEFVENGVRVHYELLNDINEYENIKNAFLLEFEENVIEEKNRISYEDNDTKVIASFFNNEDELFVQIDYISKNKDYITNDIQGKLEQIINNKSKKVKYFSYIKLRIIEENKIYNDAIINENLKDKEMINIENGKVGKALLEDGTRVNIGYVRYNTGDYIIIGTPVIFITY